MANANDPSVGDPNVPSDPNPPSRADRHPRYGEASESGTALVIVLLMLTLALAMVGGFVTTLVTDQQLRGVDRSRTQVFYAAHGAMERLTADIGNLFMANSAPSSQDLLDLAETPPVFDQVVFEDPDGGTGYEIDFPQVDGNPQAENRQVTSGPFQGFTGLLTPYRLAVTARSSTATNLSSEVRLERTLQTVAIPLFQFGIFSETDLSYFPGANFNFGGRVHTNGNLFLATTATLNIRDRVTAVGEVIRTHLSNGWPTAQNNSYVGTVNLARAPNVLRQLAPNEGSLVGTLGSAQREPGWTNMSIGDYNGYLRNGRTGARRLDLPFVSLDARPIDLIRRGVPGEEPLVLAQRYYSLASIRILLSDTAADLTGLPGVTADAPLSLEAAGASFGGTPVARSGGNPTGTTVRTTAAIASNSNNPTTLKTITVNATTALSNAPQVVIEGTTTTIRCAGKTSTTLTNCLGVPTGGILNNVNLVTHYRTPLNTPTVAGFIKIEIQRVDQTWQDVTQEILDLGISGRNLANSACTEPRPNAVIRIQRFRDDPGSGPTAPSAQNANTVPNRCGTDGTNHSTVASDYVPNTLFDAREGYFRVSGGSGIPLAGVMHYVELDVRNLRRWFDGDIPGSGTQARGRWPDDGTGIRGYTLYFSDRRTNRDNDGNETGEFGFEDFVNPGSANGSPNSVLDDGEDVNGNSQPDWYGKTPLLPSANPANCIGTPTLCTAPLNSSATLTTTVTAEVARYNRPVFFRRALKLVNGSLGNLPMPGFTVAAENPVYVQGHYNAVFSGCNIDDASDPPVACHNDLTNSAAAVIADAVTLLSNDGWNDRQSFTSPGSTAGRVANTTWYRMAILSGKGRSFEWPTATNADRDFGTDGGVHNFLRYLENWGGKRLNYRGSIASLYFNRQALGTYKYNNGGGQAVYDPPTRGYNFDVEFLDPNLLPPFTPMFRDLNTTGFTQVIR